jgi:rubrerythrin
LWEMVQEEEMAHKGAAYVPPTVASSASVDNNSISNGKGQGKTATARPPNARRAQYDQGTSSTWTCNICTLNNPTNYLCCDACGTEKPESSRNRPRAVIDLTQSDSPDTSRAKQSASSNTIPRPRDSRQAAPQLEVPATRTWTCHVCGRVRESRWWSCDLCGSIKLSSN